MRLRPSRRRSETAREWLRLFSRWRCLLETWSTATAARLAMARSFQEGLAASECLSVQLPQVIWGGAWGGVVIGKYPNTPCRSGRGGPPPTSQYGDMRCSARRCSGFLRLLNNNPKDRRVQGPPEIGRNWIGVGHGSTHQHSISHASPPSSILNPVLMRLRGGLSPVSRLPQKGPRSSPVTPEIGRSWGGVGHGSAHQYSVSNASPPLFHPKPGANVGWAGCLGVL